MSELTCGLRCLRGLHLAVNDCQADTDPAGDFAQRLAFGVTCEDRAALVLVDDESSRHVSALSCAFPTWCQQVFPLDVSGSL